MESEVKVLPLLSQDKPVNSNGEQKMEDFCLVCFSKVDRSKLPKQSNLLSKNLNVIFLLRNLLQVPSELLIGNFKKCGSPAYWISLCENCSQITSQAMEHHHQILTIVQQLKSIVKIFTDKMRESQSSVHCQTWTTSFQDDDKKKSMQEKRFHILTRTRDFVINHVYNIQSVSPFIEGDKLAREVEENENISSSEEDCDAEMGSVSAAPSPPAPDWQGEGGSGQVEEVVVEATAEVDKEERIKGYLALGIPLSKLPRSRRMYLTGEKWKCQHCDKEFRTSAGLNSHKNEKHAAVPGQFKCDVCGQIFNSKGYLKTHLVKAHKIYATSESGKGKRQLAESGAEDKLTKEGEEADTNKPPFRFQPRWKCKHCAKGFQRKRTLKIHEHEEHSSIPGQFICDICGTAWDTKTLLLGHRSKVHRLSRTDKPHKPRVRRPPKKPGDPVTCDLCGKSFSWMHLLKNHVKFFHEKKFDIHCQLCGMGVYNEHNLKMHLMTTHKDSPETLKMIEEGAKVWKCEVKGCRAAYLKESSLEKHKEEVHGGGNGEEDGSKRFACVCCGKTFWYSYNLKCHENNHKQGADDKPHSCDICGPKFRLRSSMKKHQKRFHPSDINTETV